MAHDLIPCETRADDTAPSAMAGAVVIVCTTCRARTVDEDGSTRYGERVGAAVNERLCAALRDQGLAPSVAVTGAACMAGCGRPCAIAIQAPGKAGYLFGSIETDEEISAIATFAGQYLELADGWCSSLQRPEALKGKTLARLPAPVVAFPLSMANAEIVE
jgi:predicted metal-binding protein